MSERMQVVIVHKERLQFKTIFERFKTMIKLKNWHDERGLPYNGKSDVIQVQLTYRLLIEITMKFHREI